MESLNAMQGLQKKNKVDLVLYFGALLSGTQGLCLALCLELTSCGTLGTIYTDWDAN